MSISIWADDKNDAYDYYLNQHRENVVKAFHWLEWNMPSVVQELISEDVHEITHHDKSKDTMAEYKPYADYFYSERTEQVCAQFDYAWLHHVHNNAHHWQFWVVHDDEGSVKAVPMHHRYIVEMICDWWSFSWSKGNLYEIFDWYEEHKDKMILHERTRNTVESILDNMKTKLDITNFA